MTTVAPQPDAAVVRRPAPVTTAWIVLAVAALLAAVFASVAIGSRHVGLADIWHAVLGQQDTLNEAAVTKRIPRTILAAVVGAALAVSGAVMQGVTRNPLADPGILGVNMGAALAIVIGITTFGLSSVTSYVWVAIVGAGLAAVFVYSVGSLGRGGATPLKLALAGTATTVAFISLIRAVVLPRGDVAGLFLSWEIGGVGGATFSSLRQVAPFLVVGFVVSLAVARPLNSLALGDELATGLGERVAVTRALSAIGAVLLCAGAVAAAGPIMYVGLIAPHVCRLIVGTDHRWLLPFSAVLGAVLLTVADVLGRIVNRPDEIDVGILAALVGAPFFIYIVRKQKVREL
ncbi:FecCD family ABC transporter permease [Cryptosporangium sp. NPDC048952]|uniref:FecCD family ABC transporter permease n=1 Tax=Cryptosporangium sp. NPDC048952 TaxID=3363961 RepID=UPI0037234B8A